MGRRGKNFWFVCCNNPQGVKVDLSTWPRYLSIQLRSAQGKHRRGKENTSGKPPSVLGTFKFPPRIPGNREREANLMRAEPPKEALAKGQRELGVPRPTTHALSTPPGSTSPPHGRPPLYRALTPKHPGPSHFCHAAPLPYDPLASPRSHWGVVLPPPPGRLICFPAPPFPSEAPCHPAAKQAGRRGRRGGDRTGRGRRLGGGQRRGFPLG